MTRDSKKATAVKSKPSIKPARDKSGKGAKIHKSQDETLFASLELQQKCLNIFKDALKLAETDTETLQAVKGHLYNRDFATAFGKEEYLRVYASRWSPSRALGYIKILASIQDDVLTGKAPETDSTQTLNVACIGGGAGAEVTALAGWLHLLQSHHASCLTKIDANFIDIAAWTNVVANLHARCVNPPELSKYASTAAKEANVALLSPTQYVAKFEQLDILAMDEQRGQDMFANTDLVTLMFTLNELYTTSMPKTQHMLATLTRNLRPGAHLLVVDSPGSYSTVSINENEKKYPMQWLLDYTLIGAREKSGDRPAWQKVVTDESQWFRLSEELEYPIELENMRYQIHLYRRLAHSVSEDG